MAGGGNGVSGSSRGWEQLWAANGRRERWRPPACRQQPPGTNRAETWARTPAGSHGRGGWQPNGWGSPGRTSRPEAGGSLAGRSPASAEVTAACDPGTPAGDARPEPRPRSNGPVDNSVDSLGRTWGVSVDACGKGL